MKFEDRVYQICDYICRVFLLAMVLIVTIVVIGRYVFNKTPGWGEELAITCMIWFGLLSSAMAEKRDEHIRVAIMDKVYPKIMVKILHRIFYFAKIFFALVMTIDGYKIMKFNISATMSGLPLSMAFMYAAGPIMGIAMLLFLILRFRKEMIEK